MFKKEYSIVDVIVMCTWFLLIGLLDFSGWGLLIAALIYMAAFITSRYFTERYTKNGTLRKLWNKIKD